MRTLPAWRFPKQSNILLRESSLGKPTFFVVFNSVSEELHDPWYDLMTDLTRSHLHVPSIYLFKSKREENSRTSFALFLVLRIEHRSPRMPAKPPPSAWVMSLPRILYCLVYSLGNCDEFVSYIFFKMYFFNKYKFHASLHTLLVAWIRNSRLD